MKTSSISNETAAKDPKAVNVTQNFSLDDVTSIHTLQNNSAQELMTNEEWPEIFDDGKVGECRKAKTTPAAKESKSETNHPLRPRYASLAHDARPPSKKRKLVGERRRVKTRLASKEPKTVDIENIISHDDLESIHRDDPFMYYSIPGVRRAKVLMRDVDLADLGSSSSDGGPRRRKVSRSTCISFECHPDLILEGLMDYGPEEPTVDAETLMNILRGAYY